MIEQYRFGAMVINGSTYNSDVILFGTIVKNNWRRIKGHELCVADIDQSIDEFNPGIVIIGTGKFGMMKILPDTESFLQSRQIRLIVQKTGQACETYNRLFQSERVLGAFHLTC